MALGVALLTAAVSSSMVWSRWEDGDLDVAVFLVGVVATLGLLGTAVAVWQLVADPERRATLLSWPAATGAVGAGAMLAVGIEDMAGLGYLAGAVILGISLLGHVLAPRPPFVLSGLVGLGVVYLQLLDDLFDSALDVDGLDDNQGTVLGIAVVVFTVLVTLAAKLLLPSGDFAGLIVGTGAVLITVLASTFLGVFAAIESAFSGLGEWDEETGEVVATPEVSSVHHDDLWVLLGCGAVLVLFWSWLAWSGGAPGYRVLALAEAALLVPVISVALNSDHPIIWVVVLLVAGVGVLGALLLKVLGVGTTPSLQPPVQPGE